MGDVGLGELLTPALLIAAMLAVSFVVSRLRAARLQAPPLARCRTCRARVSTRAGSCPACGGPL